MGMAAQDGVDDFPLYPLALAVNDTDLGDPQAVAFAQVFTDHVGHLAGAEGVQVEHAVDGRSRDVSLRVLVHRQPPGGSLC